MRGGTAMIVTSVTVYVKKERVDEFIAASLENHENSVKESGNLRFDVLQSMDDPCRFLLYEAYATEAAAQAHKTTAHYLKWKNAVEPWMAKPREGVRGRGQAPGDRAPGPGRVVGCFHSLWGNCPELISGPGKWTCFPAG